MLCRRALVAACLLGLALPGMAGVPAVAQETPEQARQRVAQAASDLEDSTDAVRAAAAQLEAVAAELPFARADAARARGELDGARAREATAAATARAAERAAQKAERKVEAASARVQEGRDAVARLARRTYQQGPLADLRSMITSGSPQELADRSTMLERVFKSENDSLHGLSRERLALARTQNELAAEREAREQAQAEAERVAQRAREVAVRAETAAARVTGLVARRGRALAAAQSARAGDLAAYREAQADSRALAERIRKAAALARAAEQARAAAAARERARARARAAVAAAAAAKANRPAPPPPPPEPRPAPAVRPRQDGRWTWPADGPLTSRYGTRRHPIFGDIRFHAGIDIGAPDGSVTVAGDDGYVTYAGPASGYGTLVLISHGTVDGADITSAYAHQSELLVSTGDRVERGDAVGRVGTAGNSTGPHLHFEVRRDGEPVDPLDWVSPP